MAFFLKTSTGLSFIPEPYSPEDRVPSVLQVRNSDGKTNSSLVRLADGNWYIRNGRRLFKLRAVPMKAARIAQVSEGTGTFVSDIDCKWFLPRVNKFC